MAVSQWSLHLRQSSLITTIYFKGHLFVFFKRHTITLGTPEHGTPAEHRKTGETQPNTGVTIGIPQNSGTWQEQRNNVTTKQHQKKLPIQKNDILSR